MGQDRWDVSINYIQFLKQSPSSKDKEIHTLTLTYKLYSNVSRDLDTQLIHKIKKKDH